MAIRRYGPGKFDTILDKYVYQSTLDGGCEELGDVETFNHYAKVSLGQEGLKDIARMAKEDGDTLTMEECRLIRRSVGAIVETRNSGAVSVDYYSSKSALKRDWDRLEKEWGEMDSGDDY